MTRTIRIRPNVTLAIVFSILFQMGISGQVRAQWVEPNKDYLISYPQDVGYFFHQFTEWEGKQWVTAGGLIVVGGIILSQDQTLREFYIDNRTDVTNAISANLAEPWGSGWYSGPFLAGLYLYGGLTRDSHHQKVALDGAKAFLIAGGGAMIIKNLFHRERPNEQEFPDPLQFHGPFMPLGKYESFVSGHTATTFALATVLAYSYDDPWVGIVAYGFAGLTGWSRLHDDVHWSSDVYFGALFGYLVGRAVVKNDSKWNITPLPNGVSLRVAL